MRVLLSVFLLLFVTATWALEPDSFVTHKDTIPNYAKNPTVVSIQSGNWFDPATWSTNVVPGTGDVVKIQIEHDINYNGSSAASIAAIGVEGALSFDTQMNNLLRVGNIIVYRDGYLVAGTSLDPVTNSVSTEIVFLDQEIPTSQVDHVTGVIDPYQYGNGLIVLGVVRMHGRDIGNTFVELVADATANSAEIYVTSVPDEWAVGDVLFFPDTKQVSLKRKWSTEPLSLYEFEIETRTITAINGNAIALDIPLTHDHKGARNGSNNIAFMPHVINGTRNIILRSENPDGVRAHGMFTERADVDIRFVEFRDMGRTTHFPLDNTTENNGTITHVGTNQIGRYPVHFHHHMGPVNPTDEGYQSYFIGNAVKSCFKWCASWHGASFALAENNFFFDATGASVMTEGGNETGTTFLRNFALKVGFPSDHFYEVIYGGVTRAGQRNSFGDFGYEGTAFWFTGNDLIVEGNVAANASYALYMFNGRPVGKFGNHEPRIPLIRGADIANDSQWKQYHAEWAPEIISFKSNVGYVAANGLWNSFAGTLGKLEDTSLWNIRQKGVYSQRLSVAEYDGLTIINDQSVSNQHYAGSHNKGISLATESIYHAGQNTFRNFHIEGFTVGVKLSSIPNALGLMMGLASPPVTAFVDGYLQNFVNIWEFSPRHAEKNTVLKNVEMVSASGPSNDFVSDNPADIIATLESPWGERDILLKSQFFVLDHNGSIGDNFKFYFNEQAPDFVMPERIKPNSGGYVLTDQQCPTVGMTNSECRATYGKSILDQVAPCRDTMTRNSLIGITCDISDTSEPEALLNQI